MTASFEELVDAAAAAAASVDGWDFLWLGGRATEERPSWGYAQSMAARLADPAVRAALDVQTGGGEVLASASTYPPVEVATEGQRIVADGSFVATTTRLLVECRKPD